SFHLLPSPPPRSSLFPYTALFRSKLERIPTALFLKGKNGGVEGAVLLAVFHEARLKRAPFRRVVNVEAGSVFGIHELSRPRFHTQPRVRAEGELRHANGAL